MGWPSNTLTQYEHNIIRPSAARLIQLLLLCSEEEERHPIVAEIEARGIRPADLSAIALILHKQGAQASISASEVNP